MQFDHCMSPTSSLRDHISILIKLGEHKLCCKAWPPSLYKPI